jgi:hypothetical protein
VNESPIKYRRLPGRGRRGWVIVATRCSLWLGPDHLLDVQSMGVNEEYKRYYFRDIQSISIEQNRTALMWNYIYGIVAVCMGALFYAFSESAGPGAGATAFLVTGGIISGICLVALIVNFLRGPSCICRLRTAVQMQELPSLARTHAAQRTLAIVKPLIEQAQGTLSGSELGAAAAAGQIAQAPPQPGKSAISPGAAMEVVVQQQSKGYMHLTLFAALMIDAVDGFLTIAHPRWHTLDIVNIIFTLGILAFSLTTLVRQRRAILPDGLKKITVATFVWNIASMAIVFLYSYFYQVSYVIAHPGTEPSHTDLYSLWGYTTLALVVNTLEMILGIAGLILSIMHILSRRQAAAAAETGPLA